jgi:isochorismate synthase
MNRYWAACVAEDLDPLLLMELASASAGRSYLKTCTGSGELTADLELAGMGEALVLEASGATRLKSLSAQAARCFEHLQRLTLAAGDRGEGALREAEATVTPLFLGGFSFDPDGSPGGSQTWQGFTPARLVLPELLVQRRAGRSVLIALAPAGTTEAAAQSWLRTRLNETLRQLCAQRIDAAPVAPVGAISSGTIEVASSPRGPATDYQGQVRSALRAIADGSLLKVAVARSERLPLSPSLQISAVLTTLRTRFPQCHVFCIQPPRAAAFVGASPERLLSCSGGRVSADALAGTAPRGQSQDEDEALGIELMRSSKERREHAAVVNYLRAVLTPLTLGLAAAEVPALMRLANVQHLHTAFEGDLRGDEGILDLVQCIHPTPAVAGLPTDAAIAWLAREEDLDRGWYAGGVGFVGPEGEGTFCVAIRSGLVAGDSVTIYAGAGIVEGSRPEAESAEVDHKLAGLKEVLLHA